MIFRAPAGQQAAAGKVSKATRAWNTRNSRDLRRIPRRRARISWKKRPASVSAAERFAYAIFSPAEKSYLTSGSRDLNVALTSTWRHHNVSVVSRMDCIGHLHSDCHPPRVILLPGSFSFFLPPPPLSPPCVLLLLLLLLLFFLRLWKNIAEIAYHSSAFIFDINLILVFFRPGAARHGAARQPCQNFTL